LEVACEALYMFLLRPVYNLVGAISAFSA